MTTYKIEVSNGLEYTDYKDLKSAQIACDNILSETRNKNKSAQILVQFNLEDFCQAAIKANLIIEGTDKDAIIVTINGVKRYTSSNCSAGLVGELIIYYLFEKYPTKDRLPSSYVVEKTITTDVIIESLKFLRNPTGTESLMHECLGGYGNCHYICQYIESVITHIFERAE